ncbi:MipA/OmpV family protein [Mitsuaria sp. CC2]|jgi:MipA family protein|uniref:MipA/OmpV family protein n=1 Tax=Mitsuaria sp. CC2 TaxID=3029186 RepID=UPI003B8C6FBD
MKQSLAASLAVVSVGVFADAPAERKDLPLWELGAGIGGISQVAYPGADEQVSRVVPLPYVVYRGKRLRAEGEGAGLRAIRTETFELDVSVSGSLSSGSKSLKAREGMAKLPTLVELGPVGRWYLNGRQASHRVTFKIPVRGVFEASDLGRHRGMALEPEIGLDHRAGPGWSYALAVSALLGDKRLGRTYYAVTPDEALPGRPAYEADAGLIAWRLKGSLSRQLSEDVRIFGFARIDSVAGSANRDSPLVRRTTGASVGVGLVYTFGRSTARAVD